MHYEIQYRRKPSKTWKNCSVDFQSLAAARNEFNAFSRLLNDSDSIEYRLVRVVTTYEEVS